MAEAQRGLQRPRRDTRASGRESQCSDAATGSHPVAPPRSDPTAHRVEGTAALAGAERSRRVRPKRPTPTRRRCRRRSRSSSTAAPRGSRDRVPGSARGPARSAPSGPTGAAGSTSARVRGSPSP